MISANIMLPINFSSYWCNNVFLFKSVKINQMDEMGPRLYQIFE